MKRCSRRFASAACRVRGEDENGIDRERLILRFAAAPACAGALETLSDADFHEMVNVNRAGVAADLWASAFSLNVPGFSLLGAGLR